MPDNLSAAEKEFEKEPEKEDDEQVVHVALDIYIPLKNVKETYEKASGGIANDLNEVSLLSMTDVAVQFTVESALKVIFEKVEVNLQQEEEV